MRYVCSAAVAALSILSCSTLFAQGGTQTVGNFQFVKATPATLTLWDVTYSASLINTGGALGSATAQVGIGQTGFGVVRVVPGQDTLTFGPVPANGSAPSTNTITLLVNRTASPAFNFNMLTWTITTTPAVPIANAGPNQTVTVGSAVTLDGSGSTNPSGVGTLSYTWQFTSRPPGTHAILVGASTVNPHFIADVQGSWTISLTVSNNGGSTNSAPSFVTVSTSNSPPVANPGPNQTVAVNSTVTLNGSGSTDVDGDTLTYSWVFTKVPSGSGASLNAANTVSPTFVPDLPGEYDVQLTVNDGHGNTNSATVIITTQNSAPVANAGPNQTVNVGSPVQLSGAGSTDVDGDTLTYSWSFTNKPGSSQATLSNPNIVNPTFTADQPGTYNLQLIVNDGHGNSNTATMSVSTSVVAPTANAGQGQTVQVGAVVQLSGSGTDPQNLPLTYQWSLPTKPTNSNAVLSSATIQNPTFVADLPGNYAPQLIVNNGVLSSAPSTVAISSIDTPPVANPGQGQTVTVNTLVTLNGSGSTDTDGHALTYSWSILSRPSNTDTVNLTGANTVSPTFTPDLLGTYVVQLIVNDGFLNSNPQTVSITVIGQPAITLAPSPLNIDTSGPGTLTLTLPAAAGTNGQVINLSNGAPSVIHIPNNVTVPQGSTSVNVTVSPVGPGTATITAFQGGFTQATATVNVVTAAITLTTDSGNLGVTHTMNGQITLTAPAPSTGTTVALSASPLGVLNVQPASVTIAAGGTTGAFTVTGLAVSSATISGTSGGYTTGTANVSVKSLGQINLQSGVSVGPNQSASIAVSLVSGAPQGGVTINLSSGNTSIATISPATVFIAQGATTPTTQPQVTGVNFGTANISASATGFNGASQNVVVSATLSFQPTSLTMLAGANQNLTLNLSAPAPAGLTINLSSTSTAAATVPTSLPFPANATSITVPVTAVASGSTVIHASSLPNLTDVTANVTVSLLGQISLPSGLTVQSGQQTPLNISLSAAAPPGGITITLVNSNPSQVSLNTTSVVIPQNATVPVQQPQVTGIQVTGSPLPTISASANGYTSGSTSVTVTPGTGASVTITNNGQSAQVTKAYSLPLVVTVKDTNSNLVPNATVTFTLPSSGPSVTLSPAGPYTTNAQGTVTVNATANAIAGALSIGVTASQGSNTISLTNTAGPANSISASSGTPQSIGVGTAFGAQLVATVTDASNNPIQGVSVTFAGPGSGPSATFSPSATLTTDANGQVKVTATANSTAGAQYTVTATATGVATPANFLLTNTAGQAKNVNATGGATQNTPINAAFGTALQVTVTDANNNPVSGQTVTFTVNAVAGAGASFTGANTAVTNASGIATANTLTANNTAGAYTVTASVAVAGSSSATFNLTNNAPATVTAGVGANQQTLINTNFPTALSVTVTDSHGNPVPNVQVQFAGPTGSVPSIVTATATTNASGVASTLVAANTVAGAAYTINATVAGVATPAAFANMTNKPGAVATLTISGGNGQSVQVGAPFAQLQVTAIDASNNPVQGATVTFTPAAGASGANGTFSSGNTATTNASGIALSPNTLTANTKAGSFTVVASSGTASTTFNLTNLPGPAAAIVATGGATQSVKTGNPYVPFVATVTDANNNPVPNVTVTFTINPVNGAGGTFAGGNTAVTTAAGVATSNVLTANSTIGAFTVTASVSGLGATATYNLTNLGGDPKTITASAGNNAQATVGTAYGTNLAVTVKDANNNLLPGVTVTFTITAGGNGATATFTNGNTATTNASGVATANLLTANTIAGAFTVTASANGGANGTITTTFNLTNTAGAASKVAMVSGSPQQTTVGTAFGAQLVALVTDANNNAVGAGVPVTFAGSGIASISPVNTDNTGTAKASVTANSTAGSYAVTASVSGGTASATFNLTNLPGPPAAVVIVSGNNQNTSLNSAFANPLVVSVVDAFNNPVPGVVVSFAGPGSGAGIKSSPVASQPTNSAGTAQVSVTANGTAGSYTVTATPASGSGSAAFTLTNNPPTPGGISAQSGGGQSTPIYNAFANPLKALVVDSGNNPLPGVSVTFTAKTNSTTGSSATFGGVTSSTATVTTDANGVATSPLVIANGNGPVTINGFTTPGTYSVTAAITSNQTLSTAFVLTNTAPPGIVVSASSIGQNLESIITISLPSSCTLPAPAGCSVQLSSNNPSGLLFANHQGDTGSATLSTSIPNGGTSVGVYVQGLASSGTATVTAASSGFTSGTSTVQLTPSGFVLANTNQVVGAPSFVTNVGSQSIFTVYSAQLDASNNYMLPQPVRGGLSPGVVVNSSNTGVISGTSVTFSGGVSSQTFTFTPQTAGSATLSLAEPTGFQTPTQGDNSIQVTVQSASLSAPSLTLGPKVQTNLQVVFNGSMAAPGTNVTITSGDPTKLLFSTDPTLAGQASITITLGGLNPSSHTQDFYAQGLATSGTVTYTFSSAGYGSNTAQVTMGPAGIVVAPPGLPFLNGQYLTQVSQGSANFSIFPALLDGSGNQVSTTENITIAGGQSVSVNVTSSNTAAGTISTSPLSMTGGGNIATTQFVPVSGGVTTVSLSVPTGFSTPSAASNSFTVQVLGPKLSVTGDGLNGGAAPVIGQNLQIPGTVKLGQTAANPVTITLTSNSANLLISATEGAAGSSTATITIPAGSSTGTYWLQAVGTSGSASYTATATGFQTGTGSVTFAASAAVIFGPSGDIVNSGISFFTTHVASGASTFTVQTVVNDGTCTSSSPNSCNYQEMAAGASATINLQSSSTNGTISTPVTLNGAQGTGQATFTPVANGSNIIISIQSATGLSGTGFMNGVWNTVRVTIN